MTTKEETSRRFYRIGDAAEQIGVKPYVLRYWETEFQFLQPNKSNSGQRVYRPTDLRNLMLVKYLLHHERFSIEGARKKIRELQKEGKLKDFIRDRVMPQLGSLKVEDLAMSETEVAEAGGEVNASSLDQAIERVTERQAPLPSQIHSLGVELQVLVSRPVAALFRY